MNLQNRWSNPFFLFIVGNRNAVEGERTSSKQMGLRDITERHFIHSQEAEPSVVLVISQALFSPFVSPFQWALYYSIYIAAVLHFSQRSFFFSIKLSYTPYQNLSLEGGGSLGFSDQPVRGDVPFNQHSYSVTYKSPPS